MSLQRIKWNRLKTDVSMLVLGDYFSASPYSVDKGFGFLNIEKTNAGILASYIESTSVLETSVDPFGIVTEQERINYETINFSIEQLNRNLYLLSLINAPKSSRCLFNRLSADFDYRLGFGAVDVKINDIIDSLRSMSEVSLLRIQKAKVSSLLINADAKATIEIASNNNAISDLDFFIEDRTYILDKIKASIFFEGKNISFEISKNGSLCTGSKSTHIFNSLIKNQIIDKHS